MRNGRFACSDVVHSIIVRWTHYTCTCCTGARCVDAPTSRSEFGRGGASADCWQMPQHVGSTCKDTAISHRRVHDAATLRRGLSCHAVSASSVTDKVEIAL
jgi:hypothetical protein